MKKLSILVLLAYSLVAFAAVENYDAVAGTDIKRVVEAEDRLVLKLTAHAGTIIFVVSGDEDLRVECLHHYSYAINRSNGFNGFSTVIYEDGALKLNVDNLTDGPRAIAVRTISIPPLSGDEQKSTDPLDQASTLDLLYLTVKHIGKDSKKLMHAIEKSCRPEVKIITKTSVHVYHSATSETKKFFKKKKWKKWKR